ncbi:uncharacterized protein LOC131001468 [Salvia miltiorrhiza]|uniref:uncharacterized protein LOC131001468 n=1 Tax=Salvia miltiorrhiza TaxID=226208 RepID=UPI0025ACCE04|nr:uncharacterized protein LOC131001468 [Salvia miltiorrhiza]
MFPIIVRHLNYCTQTNFTPTISSHILFIKDPLVINKEVSKSKFDTRKNKMSAKILSSSPSYYYLSCSHVSCRNTRNSSQFHPLPPIKRAPKFDQTRDFLKSSAKYGIISTGISRPRSVQVRSSASPNNPSSSWKKWLIGILLTVILPAVGYKGGLFAILKSKIDKAVEVVEEVAEMVEEVAERAEKIVEEVEEKLPEDSKLREALESFDELAKKAANEAKKAEDAVNKVKQMEEEIEAKRLQAGKVQSNK